MMPTRYVANFVMIHADPFKDIIEMRRKMLKNISYGILFAFYNLCKGKYEITMQCIYRSVSLCITHKRRLKMVFAIKSCDDSP